MFPQAFRQRSPTSRTHALVTRACASPRCHPNRNRHLVTCTCVFHLTKQQDSARARVCVRPTRLLPDDFSSCRWRLKSSNCKRSSPSFAGQCAFFSFSRSITKSLDICLILRMTKESRQWVSHVAAICGTEEMTVSTVRAGVSMEHTRGSKRLPLAFAPPMPSKAETTDGKTTHVKKKTKGRTNEKTHTRTFVLFQCVPSHVRTKCIGSATDSIAVVLSGAAADSRLSMRLFCTYSLASSRWRRWSCE